MKNLKSSMIKKFNSYLIIVYSTKYKAWGLGIGDWGLAQSPIPNPQSPIPLDSTKYSSIFLI